MTPIMNPWFSCSKFVSPPKKGVFLENITYCQCEEMLIENIPNQIVESRERDILLQSPPFIANHHGCKFCLHVALDKVNVSVGIQLIKGDKDDHLVWPFNMIIIFQLQNQNGGEDRVKMFQCKKNRTQLKNSLRRPKTSLPNLPMGYPDFIAQQDLWNDFVKDDTMLLRCYLFPKNAKIDLPSERPSVFSLHDRTSSSKSTALQDKPFSELLTVAHSEPETSSTEVTLPTSAHSEPETSSNVATSAHSEPETSSTVATSAHSQPEPSSTAALLPQHLLTKSTALLQNVPFIEEIDSYSCDFHGATLSIHDITVTIPPGAIPDEITAHIEMGVALYGPFKFPNNCQPVSPILWFCIQEDIELLLPLTFRLPHVIADISRANITFIKADHITYQDSVKRDMFTFQPVLDGESDFTRESGYGYLSSKHCCFLCLNAENNITKDLALKKGYCLHILIENRSPASYRILLFFTYFLGTCFEVCHS